MSKTDDTGDNGFADEHGERTWEARSDRPMDLWETALERALEITGSMWDTFTDPDLQRRLENLPKDNVNEFGYDSFGYSPEYVKKVLPLAALFYRYYFRTLTYNIENVPSMGRVMLVSNHSGQLPFDGTQIASSMLLDADPPRTLRSMVERWVPTLPFASVFLSRCGQVVGTPENCRLLLGDDEAILVFPEGVKGISKTFDKRYQLQKFGYGFMRLAIETGTPIVPVAVVGAEEQAPSLYNWESMARLIGAPAVPITPLVLLLGPLGLLPMPVRYHIHFGEPMRFEGNANDDDGTIGRHVKKVKTAIAELLEYGLSIREGIFS
jgi:1-acyl-sn-glycerol-3-phosphate acyltransferase